MPLLRQTREVGLAVIPDNKFAVLILGGDRCAEGQRFTLCVSVIRTRLPTRVLKLARTTAPRVGVTICAAWVTSALSGSVSVSSAMVLRRYAVTNGTTV